MPSDRGDAGESSLWTSLADLVVYAPIGLTLDAQELAPELARRGRQHTAAARRIGEFAVKAGMRRLDDLVAALDPSPSQATAPVDAVSDAASDLAAPDVGPPPKAPPTAATVEDAPAESEDVGLGGPDELAIPGYDLLAASQVVKRLDGLDPDQLEAIRRHEEAGRGRRTILHKITRLQSR